MNLLHQLNQDSQPEVSSLSLAELENLIQSAAYFSTIDRENKVAAFVLALDPQADYQSPNFLWFKSRYTNFIYIDRVVVAKEWRSQGLGQKLYSELFEFARRKAFEWVCCEVNSRPPNPLSMSFHHKMGFEVVGEQDTEAGKKRVQLMTRKILP